MKMTRRRAGRLLLAAPLAAAAAGPVTGLLGSGVARAAADPAAPAAPPAEPPATPLADLLAGQEEGLTAEERAKIRKDVTELEGSLRKIREFPLSNDVPPAGTFTALKSKRRS